MSTIKDVARHAGVSTMTVSRVINNSGYASAETRAKVERAIDELGFVPNALARHLRSKATRSLALVLPDITNPFFTTIARGVEDVAAAHEFAVFLCNTDESLEEESRCIEMLVQRQIDGVALVPAGSSQESFKLLRARNVPVVALDRRVSTSVDQVRSDSEAGAHRLVCHLLALGHTRIAMLTGRRSISTSADRIAGFRRALEEHGIPFDPAFVRFGGYEFEGGYAMARELLGMPSLPTAIFAANDLIAFGAIRALGEAGLSVPQDVSIVCFDDLLERWLPDPFLTVVEQGAYEIGRQGAELILERIEGKGPSKARSVILPVDFRVRRSTAAPHDRHEPPALSGKTADLVAVPSGAQ